MTWVEGLFLGMLAGWGAAYKWLPGWRWFTLAVGVFALWAVGSGWIAGILMSHLRVPPVDPLPPFAAQVSIVVLGGGTVFDAQQGHFVPRRDAYMKGLTAAALYRRCRSASPSSVCTVFLSGGDPERHGITEAEAFRRELATLGVPPEDIRLESRSQNTYQNAKFIKTMLGAQGAGQVFLITAPYHMKRAVELFERFGLHPIPLASELAPPKPDDPLRFIRPVIENVRRTMLGVHEVLGRVQIRIYAALGRF